MSEDKGAAGAQRGATNAPGLARFIYWGAAAGVLSGLSTLLAISLYYGSTVTETATECAVFGGAFTVLLSQPAAFIGLIAGAATGAVLGGAAIGVRHFRPAR